MSIRIATPLALLIALTTLLAGCGGDEEEPLTSLEDADALAFFYADKPRTPALVVYKSGETMVLLSDDGGNTISGAVFGFPNAASLLVEGGDNGLPSRAYVGGYTFIFENWQSDTVDVGVVDPLGVTEVFRDIDCPEESVAAPMLLQGAGSPESAIKAGQLFISAGACVISGVAAILSGGVAIPIAKIACSKFAVKATVMILAETAPDSPWTKGLEIADTALGVAGCAIPNPLSAADCVDVALTITNVVIGESDEVMEADAEAIQVLKEALGSGGGGGGQSFESEGIVFLPVTPGGSITIDGATFDVDVFYIAKHETTNAQYDAFVQAGDGFDSAAWWSDMPAEWSPPRQGLFDSRNSASNAPRETVSWYQAVAFTRWLNARMAAKNADISAGGLLVNGVEWEVRLPTEWEWQWAAQGGAEERAYPWGDWQEGHANTWETGVHATIAVGSYPQGAAVSGALDMSGNVWEWCLNKYSPPYDIVVDTTDESRVLRGGSFLDNRELAASSFRNYAFLPRDAGGYVGFRVGLFPPL